MRSLIVAALLSFGAFSTVTPATADDCDEMKAQMPGDQIWICRLAHNNGKKAKRRVGCFASEQDGFTWMSRRSGGATGMIYQISCTRDGSMMQYVDYMNR